MREEGQILWACAVILLGLSALPIMEYRQQERAHNTRVLHQAKTAVIAWMAANYPGRDDRHVRLGELVTPDSHGPQNGDKFGTQDAGSLIGRLPWRTLGIVPLQDAAGETPWYLVDSSRRDNIQARRQLHCHLVQIQLTQGSQVQKNIAAAILAPMRALHGQVRTKTNLAANYLERCDSYSNVARINDRWRLLQGVQSPTPCPLNDHILPVECGLLQHALRNRFGR